MKVKKFDVDTDDSIVDRFKKNVIVHKIKKTKKCIIITYDYKKHHDIYIKEKRYERD